MTVYLKVTNYQWSGASSVNQSWFCSWNYPRLTLVS
jgi:hypothetical protein